MTLPIVELRGSPYEQGVTHGRVLKDRIAHNLSTYFERFQREVGLGRDEVLARARDYGTQMTRDNADYMSALQGVADGSGFDRDSLIALNIRYEILYFQFGKNALAAAAATAADRVDGCTAFAILPEASANGHLIVGQNWDWIPEVQGAVLHTWEADGLETLTYTEAGIVGGKIGFNSAGVALMINGMTSTDDNWARLAKPFHVRCYEILRSRDFDTAVAVVTDQPRACSTNFLVAQNPDNVIDIEAAPDKFRLIGCQDDCLVHTNHFDDPASMGVVEPPNERRPYSYHRRAKLTQLLAAHHPVSIDDVHGYLQDHELYPFGVCRHRDTNDVPERHYVTVTSVVMDLEDKVMWLTDGPPCENPVQEVRLADINR